MKKNRLIAAVLALSCAFGSAAFAAEGTEATTAPDSAVEATAEPSATEAATEQVTEKESEAPTETATEDITTAPTPTIDVNAPKLYERPAFIPAPTSEPTAEPTDAPTATAEAVPSETASAEPSEAETAAPSDVPEQGEGNELSMRTSEDGEESTTEPEETATEQATEAAAEQETEAVSEAPSEAASEAPSETATAAPTATPTAAPTATPTPLPAKQTVTLKSLLGTATLNSKYTDAYYTDIKAVIVDISGSNYTYGNGYDATYNGTALTERQFSNLMAGYVEETLSEMKLTASGSTLYGILSNITVRISPVASITTTPVFEKKATDTEAAVEWYYFPEYTKTTCITMPTAIATAAPTSTPKPTKTNTATSGSSTTRRSSGNSSQIATAGNSGSSTTLTGSPYSIGGFTDLGSVPWAQTAITVLSAKGIINGRSDSIFDPDANITRAEFAKIVCTALNITDNGNSKEFSDVSTSDWFYPYVRIAAGSGIVNGVSDTAFDPNAVIKREDMATMLYRAINVSGNSLPSGTSKSFADEGSINDYAKESVAALSAAGVINGVSDTEFSPASTATRAQSAAIIYQYFTAAGIK